MYILEINLCQFLHLKIFSPILSIVNFILFMVFFDVKKLLISFHWFIFVFILISLGSGSKKSLLRFLSRVLCMPIFSSKSFVVSGLTFRSLIHF